MRLTQRAAFAVTEGVCEKKKMEIKLEAPQKNGNKCLGLRN